MRKLRNKELEKWKSEREKNTKELKNVCAELKTELLTEKRKKWRREESRKKYMMT
jgi:hypothetical protein